MTGKTWEYAILIDNSEKKKFYSIKEGQTLTRSRIKENYTPITWLNTLNDMGENGWELVTSTRQENETHFYFKREIQTKETRNGKQP